jgi:hypothetical protein
MAPQQGLQFHGALGHGYLGKMGVEVFGKSLRCPGITLCDDYGW